MILKISKSTLSLAILIMACQSLFGSEVTMIPIMDDGKHGDHLTIPDEGILDVKLWEDNNNYGLHFEFDNKYGLLNEKFTNLNLEKKVKFYIDGTYYSTAKIIFPSRNKVVVISQHNPEQLNKFIKLFSK